MIAIWALVVLLQEERPKGLAGVGLKQEDVNRAVDRGVAFVRGHYADTPLHPDEEDLVAILALIHAAANRRHPEIDAKIHAALHRANPANLGTYEAGVLAMICESLGDARYLPLLIASVQRLLDVQGQGGSWGYGSEDAPRAISEEPKKPRVRVTGRWPESVRKGNVLKRTPGSEGENGKDNSASQYAVLGLYSAIHAGVSMDPEALRRALQYYLEGQSEDGGWGYGPLDGSYGSMTCAGVASVAICAYALGEKDWREQQAVRKGVAWLAKNFTVKENPPRLDESHYYYLYGLERVGRILGTEFIGKNEWYPLGAKYLVEAQKENGSWESPRDGSALLVTSYALLFLTRATPSPSGKRKAGGKGTLVTATAAGSGVYHVLLDASASMRKKMGAKSKFEIAQESVCSIVESLPEGTRMGLRVYGHHRIRDPEEADRDTELLVPLGPLDKNGYSSVVRKLGCFGKTPLTLSLRECAKDLEGVGKERVTVILLTDGGESTQGADPVAAAADLVRERPRAVVHVIAFDIADSRERKQCEAISQAGRGRCFLALKADELFEQLRQVFATRLPYELADKDGRKIADGVFGDRRELPEGAYRIHCVVRGERIDEEIWIATEETTTATVEIPEERPAEAEKREVPRGKRPDGLELTVGDRKYSLRELACHFTPASEEEDGTLSFDGALTATMIAKARKREELKSQEFALTSEATLKLDEERTLSSKEAVLRIDKIEGSTILGTIGGVFLLGEKEVRVRGTFRAEFRKNER